MCSLLTCTSELQVIFRSDGLLANIDKHRLEDVR